MVAAPRVSGGIEAIGTEDTGGGRVVVKNTFIEVVDLPSSFCRGSSRPRYSSDSALLECGQVRWQRRRRRDDSVAERGSEADCSLRDTDTDSVIEEDRGSLCGSDTQEVHVEEQSAEEQAAPQSAPRRGVQLDLMSHLGSPPRAHQAGAVPWLYALNFMAVPAPQAAVTMPAVPCEVPTPATGSQQEQAVAEPARAAKRAKDTKAEGRTTVMLRNLPNNYSRAMLIEMLNKEGFAGLYDFLYLPIDFKSRACLGYAFINLTCPDVVPALWLAFDGYTKWVLPSKKQCSVSWSDSNQGLEVNVRRYRNSPIMHASVPDDHKPIMFVRGAQAPFPPPTKALRAPRTRNHTEQGVLVFSSRTGKGKNAEGVGAASKKHSSGSGTPAL